MSRLSFAPLEPGGFGTLRAALEAARLPTDDLDGTERRFFQLVDDEGPVGFVGVEGAGPDRLLRSLIVLPGHKRKGHGGLLIAHVEAATRRDAVERLHLLTTRVPGFFRTRGYRDRNRTTAPPAIASTSQFTSLCPASATYLVKELA